MNHVTEIKLQYKILHKAFKEEYGSDTLLPIYALPALMKLKYLLSGIQDCVTVVGNFIYDSNFTIELPLTRDYLEYF